jgi:hypothetical protein
MDWWTIKQLRAFVISDISEFINPIEFEKIPDEHKIRSNVPNYQHFTQELHWAKFAATTGKHLFFSPTLGMSARQISASDVLMNMGLLTSAETMYKMLTQLCNDAAKARRSAGNSRDIRDQLKREHIPVFQENMRGALSQYFLYLTDVEKAPFVQLLKQKDSIRSVAPEDRAVPPVDITTHHFDVALSFPGEARALVEQVVAGLKNRLSVDSYFYDNNYVSQLARPNLDLLLQDIYRNRSKIVVVFLSADYERKNWCGVEFRTIREIIFDREDKVMFVRSGDGNVSGVFKTDGYVDAKRFGAEEIAKFIHERILLAKMPIP